MNAMLLIGAAGCGKTSLARAFHRGLRLPTDGQLRKIESAYKASQLEPPNGRPFRAPHYSCSFAGMFGTHKTLVTTGEDNPRYRPGEFQLATEGVLLLDELPEFPRQVMEGLYNSEGGPSLIVGAMNACPCGMLTNPDRSCDCGIENIERFQMRVKPFLDRFDPITLWLDAPPRGIRGAEFFAGRFIIGNP